jgi:20S proteasome subunit alpha 3
VVCQLTRSNILAGLAGITSDANSLVNFARNAAQRHLFTYDEDIPVEMLVQRLCDMKQGYTQYGGESRGLPSWRPLAPGW